MTWSFQKQVVAAEVMISTQPIIIDVVSGSPMSVIPIVIAVSGSKAPKIATLAESIKDRRSCNMVRSKSFCSSC